MSGAVERIALISDVHGNLTALEAVLADIDARGISRIFNLGDYVGKGPRGREVVELCQERCEVNVLGNWDDFLPDPHRDYDDAALRWWSGQLGEGQGEWLRSLPFCHDLTMSGRRIRLMHASSETVHRRVRYVHDEAEFLGQFANTEATIAAVGDGPVPDVVGYADSHDPFYETQLERRTLFNTGSVGNCMGDPTPLYVILEGVPDSLEPAAFSIAFVRVPYDVEAELAHAREVGCPSLKGYEAELRHGIYRGAVELFEAGRPLTAYYHVPGAPPRAEPGAAPVGGAGATSSS
ncbi:metallophosphoesterase family protein [Nocardioides psychrotolerans]|uniref:metallophosphoesterase family protein n=1 Tax=Nocardioides psychrotolerans TaxID=1005945 RepID=UPI0031379263